MSEEKKPSVLVLGGVGFIGRNFVTYLVENDLASSIKVADKAHWGTSFLHDRHKAAFERKDVVKFQQADLTREAHVSKVFGDEDQFDYVFNLCGETRFGKDEEEYRTKCVEPVTKCAPAAKAMGVKKWVEVSTAQVYYADASPSNEDAKIDPWTKVAEARYEAEQVLARTDGLPSVVLRPAYVYGVGDQTSITPRLTCAIVYKELKETMKFLWGKDLLINVVHVDDVVRAMWVAAKEGASGSVYNLADETNASQGDINNMIGDIFGIKVGFAGKILSNMARAALGTVADQSNEKHIPVFTDACQRQKILNTPLSPYIDKELLRNNHLCVDGSKITKELPFKYEKQLSRALLEEQTMSYVEQGLFPKW